jgi:hypothetical protein
MKIPVADYHGDRTMVVGIEFIDENGGGPGVRFRKRVSGRKR